MIVAMMQPTFIPWAGYFALIAACDTFVLLDDFQFQRRSFHHRNRLFLSVEQPGWVTVPVEHSHSDDRPAINEIRPLLDSGFRGTFRRLLTHNYGQSAFFQSVTEPLTSVLEQEWASLADLNIALIECLSSLLGLAPTFVRSSAIGSTGSRSSRLADLLGRIEATGYVAAAGAEDYMRADGIFPLAGVETRFQNYVPVAYEQRQSSEFVPYLSVLDMILQIGSERARDCVKAGAREHRLWTDTTVPM